MIPKRSKRKDNINTAIDPFPLDILTKNKLTIIKVIPDYIIVRQ